MSKILVKIILIFIPFISFSQKVKIEHLSDFINTIGAELNFVQTNENTAFYTSTTLEEGEYQSLIFRTELENGEWKKEPQKEIFNNLINSSKDFITDIVKDNNPKFNKTDNIEEYHGEDTNEKYVMYCNEGNYKEKLEDMAKSEVYNKSKELKEN